MYRRRHSLLLAPCFLLLATVVPAQTRTTVDAEKFATFPWEGEARIENFRAWETIFPVAVLHRPAE